MRNKPVPLKYKIISYVAAWFVALFATSPNGKFWVFAWMFPLGLAAFINQVVEWKNSPYWGGWGVFAACIGIYLAHPYFYFRSRNLRPTLFLFGVLIALLICNVSGCRAMLNTH